MKNSKLYRSFAIVFTVALFLSFSASHPVGRSGAPGDGLCSDCHSVPGSFTGEVDLIGLPGDVIPGIIYNVTAEVTVTSGNPFKGGFQIVALRNSNNSQAGSWTNASSNSSIKTSGGREYFGHEPAQNFNGNPSIDWEADWEAPNFSDDITFYMAANLANGNGSNTGDNIVVNELIVTVEEIEAIELVFENVFSSTCYDSDDGQATVVASGGIDPYSYAWDNGESNASAINLAGGTHSVTVTDDIGGSAVGMIFIPFTDDISFDIEVIEPFCNGESNGSLELIPFGGTGDLTCFWEDFGNGCLQEDLEAGIYDFTITDSNGCNAEFDFDLEEPDPLVLTVSVTDDPSGNGSGSIICIADGGIGAPYEFLWSTGDSITGNSSTLNGLTAGIYSVTVFDGNECEAFISVEVEGLICNIQSNSIINPVACNGDSTGLILLELMNATEPVSYLWSTGDSTADLSHVPAGNYSVVITDALGCVDSLAGLVISEPDSLLVVNVNTENTICTSDLSGSISFQIIGGTPGYDLRWSHGITNDTSIMGMDTLINIPDTLTNLSAGLYSFTITDMNSCVLADSIEILAIDTFIPLINCNNTNISSTSCIPIIYNEPTAFDNCDGLEIELISGLPSGSFFPEGETIVSYRATDESGNSSSCFFIVDLDFDLTVNAVAINASCDTADGQIILDIQGGQAPYIVTPNELDALDSGDYTITVLDDLGCQVQISVTVGQEVIDIDYELIHVEVSCFGGSDGSVEVIIDGNEDDYDISYSTTLDPMSLQAGEYTVIITDKSNGCSIEESFVIQEPDALEISAFNFVADACTGEFVSVNLEITGGVGAVEIDTLMLDDNVIFFATDENQCTSAIMIPLDLIDEILAIEVLAVTDSGANNNSGSISVEVSGGILPYTFEWVDETGNLISTEKDLFDLFPGEYILVVTDANGCVVESFPIIIDEITSLSEEELTNGLVLVSPNPTKGMLRLELQGRGEVSIIIYDISGKLMLQKVIQKSQTIDLSSYDAGLYIMLSQKADNVVSQLLVKQ